MKTCTGCFRVFAELEKMALITNREKIEVERCADCLEVAQAMIAAGAGA